MFQDQTSSDLNLLEKENSYKEVDGIGNKKRRRNSTSNVNPTESSFVCKICERTFASKQHFKSHTTQVHATITRPFACTKCDKRYSSKSSLQSHFDFVHIKLAIFTCEICDKSFGYQKDLKSHIDFVHLKFCLLYTSPSPRDGLLSRMPSSAWKKK